MVLKIVDYTKKRRESENTVVSENVDNSLLLLGILWYIPNIEESQNLQMLGMACFGYLQRSQRSSPRAASRASFDREALDRLVERMRPEPEALWGLPRGRWIRR